MSTYWRISNYADLQGTGGTKVAGRWHNRGIPIVYFADSQALALLETLVHIEDINDVPDSYQLLKVEYKERKGIKRLKSEVLEEGWQQNINYTRAIGDEWLTSMSSLMLKVPSVIVPNCFNFLFNPRHPLAKHAEIVEVIQHPFDERFFSEA